MTSCARGCCWTAYQVCAKSRTCDCHAPTTAEWLGVKADEAPVKLPHRDPTANQAIGRIMAAEQRKGKPR